MGIAGFFLWLQRWYEQCVENVPQEVVEAAKRHQVLLDVAKSAPQPSKKKKRGRSVSEGKEKDRKTATAKDKRLDNLYLDMNGLIHPCCHDTKPLPEPESEAEMLARIFEQLDILVKVARPQKCLILCIDGVAPRSKMNQQRSRRFRAVDERFESDAINQRVSERIQRDYKLPRPHTRSRWDHNVITPSTPFMERVGAALEWFIMKKLNDDPAWQHLLVFLSDAHVPGEGEHKIMQYIRALRAQPGYDPHTSHAINGMDADLICLGLSTHEEHISIFRNQLTETFQGDPNRFCYFNLHTFREALREDFSAIEGGDFERIIDDFIFLCFFVGNDFLPHVPLISIKAKGIELMLDHYVRAFNEHQYLTKGGEVDFDRLRIFFKSFSAQYLKRLKREYAGILRSKQRAKLSVEERVTRSEQEAEMLFDSLEPDKSNAQDVSDQLLSLFAYGMRERAGLVADRDPLPFSYQSDDFRDAYYAAKFGWDPTDRKAFEANIDTCCREYLRGAQWVMRYYTTGCPSWEWYYPYHYAPLLEDMAHYKGEVDVAMELGAPLHPVEQLLSVLPRQSYAALPEVLQEPVQSPRSVFGPFYPDKVDVDFSEATFAYQGVLRLPFIDREALHTARKTLVDLEADDGHTLLFCHEKNPVAEDIDALVRPLHGQREGKCKRIPSDISSRVPVGGKVGLYPEEWPRHERLQCPDEELIAYIKEKSGDQHPSSRKKRKLHKDHAKEAVADPVAEEKVLYDPEYVTPIANNKVRGYRYALNTQTVYVQELLTKQQTKTSATPTKSSDSHPPKATTSEPRARKKSSSAERRRSPTKAAPKSGKRARD
ncbi:5'-3' exoribonuclease 2 [Strigomonas culicis]|uniref:5'-3' exoribonuclease 2 n=1 Tax=Strigomonas culicis TaxID=28005 RepID=S9ULI7_9TRYP|nr:5'-3' exoribonuclease 2 [Strigomonas culicis]|eukprot:EPY31707.1 5'-3' exoribonuclease 2 [Strigomonas culicis]